MLFSHRLATYVFWLPADARFQLIKTDQLLRSKNALCFKYERRPGTGRKYVHKLMEGFTFKMTSCEGWVEAQMFQSESLAEQVHVGISILQPFEVYLIDSYLP